MMYQVRFIRKDKQPNEEYYYNNLEDAEYHFNLFIEDDSGLYDRIDLMTDEPEAIIKSHIFI